MPPLATARLFYHDSGIIVYSLWKEEVMRYVEWKRVKEYPQVPPKIGYGLATLGITLMPILHLVCTWGEHYDQK